MASGSVPVTVWVLDPPATATVGELRARLHATLTALGQPRSDEPTDRSGGCVTKAPAEGLGRAGSANGETQSRSTCLDPSADRCRRGIESATSGGTVGDPSNGTCSASPEGPSPAAAGRRRHDGGPGSREPVAPVRAPGGAGGRCVVLDLGRGRAAGRRIAAAVVGLGPGDVLAVLTLSHHRDGLLWDPRPELVRIATEAGLVHRQHIVTITRPDTGLPGWVLGPDISLFQPANPTPASAASTAASGSQEDV